MPATAQERFWAKVEKTSTCWLWQAATNQYGYGIFSLNGKLVSAHKLSFEWAKGQIQIGMILDHLCRTPNCVNPGHLEIVTHKENTQRGDKYAMGSFQRNKTHCSKGHEFTKKNTRMSKDNKRECRSCGREKSQREREIKQEKERDTFACN